MAALTGDTLTAKVIEVDQQRRRLIFSEREAQREWRARQKARLLDELNEGDIIEGTVTGLRDFGAFVNIGGADGLIHVSELAWHRVDHPRDILSIGDTINVFILDLDYDTQRIALSRKRLLTDPWDDARQHYHEGQLTEGVVTMSWTSAHLSRWMTGWKVCCTSARWATGHSKSRIRMCKKATA